MNGVNDVSSNIFRNSPYEVMKRALATQLRKPAKEMEVLTQGKDWVIQMKHSPYWVDYLHQFRGYTFKDMGHHQAVVLPRHSPYLQDVVAQSGASQINHLL